MELWILYRREKDSVLVVEMIDVDVDVVDVVDDDADAADDDADDADYLY